LVDDVLNRPQQVVVEQHGRKASQPQRDFGEGRV
jgi:hypothetical protein